MSHVSHAAAAPRSKDWQKGGASPSNVKNLILLLLLGDTGCEALLCYSLVTQAGVRAG